MFTQASDIATVSQLDQSTESQAQSFAQKEELILELDRPCHMKTDTTDTALKADDDTQDVHQEVPDTEVEDSDIADTRPKVLYKAGHISEAIANSEKLLGATGRFFQQDGVIVAVRSDPATGLTNVQPLSLWALTHALNDVASWWRYKEARGSQVKEDAPEKICRLLLSKGSYDHLPILTGLAQQPYFRVDGSLCQLPGYDVASGRYGSFDAVAFNIPAEPNPDEAAAALDVMRNLLDEFSFATEYDKSAALSALITAAIRPSLDLAPMFHVRAPQIASGKSFLCELITAFATPNRGQPVGFPNSDDECTKLLLAELMRVPAVIEFDNLTSDLKPFKSLCTALTSSRMQGRVLGHSKMVGVSTRAMLLSSGNNVGPIADMSRRCVTVNLDPGCDIPASRSFRRPHLVSEVVSDRGRYVSAALTVVRAWIIAGRPVAHCPPLASFGQWSELCRQPLIWLGLPDPANSVFTGMNQDPDRELLGQFLVGWHQVFGNRAMLVRDAVVTTTASETTAEDLREVFLEITDELNRVNPKKLGQWMKKNVGRQVNGLRLVKAHKTRNAESWQVESVVSVHLKSLSENVPVVLAQEKTRTESANFPEYPLAA